MRRTSRPFGPRTVNAVKSGSVSVRCAKLTWLLNSKMTANKNRRNMSASRKVM